MAQTESRGNENLERLHAEWQEVHVKLRAKEQSLSRALALYAKGKGPRPDAIIREVSDMRAECSQRFTRLMAAVREPGAPAPGAAP